MKIKDKNFKIRLLLAGLLGICLGLVISENIILYGLYGVTGILYNIIFNCIYLYGFIFWLEFIFNTELIKYYEK